MTPERVYRASQVITLIIFDLRIPGAAEPFHRERWACAEAGNVEMLDEDHAVLIIRTGMSWRLAP